MRKKSQKIFGLLLITVMIACNINNGDPKSVAKHFFEAVKATNFEEAQKYATKDSKMALQLAQMAVNFSASNKDTILAQLDKHNIEYGEPVITGNDATIGITLDKKDKINFNMKKEDGIWKMAFDLSSLMKMGMGNMEKHGASESDIKEAQKALEHLNIDSLK